MASLLTAVFVLSLMIFVHELGHFLAARRAGVGVEKFSIGFGPRVWGVRRGETDYLLSAIPFGGYVKMVGDNPEEEVEDSEKSFLLKSVWARMGIVIAGPASNILSAVLIIYGISLVGIPALLPTIWAVQEGSPAAVAGLHPGDLVTAVDGNEVKTRTDLSEIVRKNPGVKLVLTVERGGELRTISVTPGERLSRNIFGETETVGSIGIESLPSKVGDVVKGSPAAEAGLLPGDTISAIDGNKVTTWEDLTGIVHKSAGVELAFTIVRDGRTLSLAITPRASETKNNFGETVTVGLVGIQSSNDVGTPTTQRYGPLESLKVSLQGTYNMAKLTLLGLVKMVQGVVPADNLGGPVMIVQAAGRSAEQGVLNLLYFIAYVSVALGLFNLFPIPVLDGGHLFFYVIEAVRGRPLSLRKREILQQVGMVALISLMLFATKNDIFRIFGW